MDTEEKWLSDIDDNLFDNLALLLDDQPQDFDDNSVFDQEPGKKRKFTHESAAIKAETDETLKSLNLDPNSEDGKKKKRQIRNRMSAQFHRDRKNSYIKTLEDTVQQQNNELLLLRQRLNALTEENKMLRGRSNSVSYGGNTDKEDSDEASLSSYPSHSSSVPSPLPMSTLPSIKMEPGASPQFNRPQAIYGPTLLSSTKSLTVLSMMCMVGLMLFVAGPQNPMTAKQLHQHTSRILTAYKENPAEYNSLIDSIINSNKPSGVYIKSEPQENQKLLAPVVPSFDDYVSIQRMIANSTHIDNTAAAHSGDKKETKRRYLRASPKMDVDEANQTHFLEHSMAKDLVPKYAPTNYLPHQQWSSSGAFKYAAVVSHSSLIMTDGKALLDPAFSLKHSGSSNYAPFAHHAAPVVGAMPVVPTLGMESNHALTTTAPAAPRRKTRAMAAHEEDVPTAAMANLALTTATAISKELQATTTQAPYSTHDATMMDDNSGDYLYSKLLGADNSHMITIQLPTSLIRVGTSWTDSKDGSVESILNVFNITSDDATNASQQQHDVNYKPNSAASIEINCIIVGAKLVVSE